MPLQPEFEFSQSSLQDYTDCPRRYWLMYIAGHAWPAELTQPAIEYEQHLLAGQAFHLLVQQHLAGITSERLAPYVRGEDLPAWWENYLAARPWDLAGQRYVEFTLAAGLRGWRLLAKYDLIVAAPDGNFTILDWKTSRRKPPRERLSQKAQTRVYPYLLVRAGACLQAGRAVDPESVKMVYWFAQEPQNPEVFTYNADLFGRDEQVLGQLVDEISGGRGIDDFPQTLRARTCEVCTYRSYCRKGTSAPDFATLEDDVQERITSEEAADDAEYAY